MLALTAGASEWPPTLVTLKEKSFSEVCVLKAYPEGLAFAHSRGAAQIPFGQLTPSSYSPYSNLPYSYESYLYPTGGQDCYTFP